MPTKNNSISNIITETNANINENSNCLNNKHNLINEIEGKKINFICFFLSFL